MCHTPGGSVGGGHVGAQGRLVSESGPKFREFGKDFELLASHYAYGDLLKPWSRSEGYPSIPTRRGLWRQQVLHAFGAGTTSAAWLWCR